MIKIKPFSYSLKGTPKGYACQKCGMTGVKLWREYNVFLSGQTFLCKPCIEVDRKDHIEKYKHLDFDTDQLGGMVPAVPTEDGTTFWGYTSVPPEGVEWWFRLPPMLLRKPRPMNAYTAYQSILRDWDKIPVDDRAKRLDELVALTKQVYSRCCSFSCTKEAHYGFCFDCLAKLREDVQCPDCKAYIDRHAKCKICPQCGSALDRKQV